MANKATTQTKEKPSDVVPAPTVNEAPETPALTAKPAHKERGRLLAELVTEHRENRDKPADDEIAAAEAELSKSDGVTDEVPAVEAEASVEASIPAEESVKKTKFMIDGEELELTDDEIKAAVQKIKTADKRLGEATRLLEDASRQAAIPKRDDPNRQPSATASSAADARPATSETLVSELTNALMYGNEEKVSQAITTLLGRGRETGNFADDLATRTKGMSREETAGFVTQAIAFERARELLELPPDQGGFSDIWSDPVLRAEFIRREDELRDVRKDSRPHRELYTAIGTELRQWRENLITKHKPPTGLETRDQQKRATGVVRGAGGKLPPTPPERPAKTHDEIIAGMAKARGQKF